MGFGRLGDDGRRRLGEPLGGVRDPKQGGREPGREAGDSDVDKGGLGVALSRSSGAALLLRGDGARCVHLVHGHGLAVGGARGEPAHCTRLVERRFMAG